MLLGDAMLLSLAVAVIALAVVSSIVASRKRRSPILWFILAAGLPVLWFLVTAGMMSTTLSAIMTLFLATIVLLAAAGVAPKA